MSPEISRAITIPRRKESSGVLLANAMAKLGFDIRVSDSYEILGDSTAQDKFFELSDTPEMTIVFWALEGSDAEYLETSLFIKEANFHPQIKKRLKTLAEKRIKAGRPDVTEAELKSLQKLVGNFVKQEIGKRTS